MLHLKQRHQLTTIDQDPAQMQFLQLIPLKDSCVIPSTLVDFAPINGISQLPIMKREADFLPCLFISPSQKAQLDFNEQKRGDSTQQILTETFQAKVSQAQGQANQSQKVFLKPKPSTNWCQVCKQKFTDYEQHIKHDIHKQNVNKHEFSRHIERFVNIIQNQVQNNFKRSKPASQRIEKKVVSYQNLQRKVKKIVISRQECKNVSITKIDSEMIEQKDI